MQTMRLNARQLLVAAGGCALLFTAILVGVYHTAQGRWLDNAALSGFLSAIDTEKQKHVANLVARLCDPGPFLLIGFTIVAIALYRRMPRRAAGVGLILGGAAMTTQLLKPALAHAHFESDVVGFDHLINPVITVPAFPSGHATAAMSLALAGVLVAPRAWRPLIAAGGALFALAVGFALVAAGWHFPSDVVGGYLVATAWTLVTLAAIRAADARWPEAGTIRAAAKTRATPVVRDALAPAGAIVAAAAAGIALARIHRIADFAAAHTTTTLAAIAIATSAAALVAAVSIADQQPH
jgi:membrane-associated phospholipid phosphatase